MTSKQLVTTIAATIVAASAAVIAVYVSRVGFAKFPGQIVRFGLTVLLAYSLIRGWNPGRWITVVLMGLAGVGAIFGGIALARQSAAGLALAGLGALYVVCVAGLLTPKAANHFRKEKLA